MYIDSYYHSYDSWIKKASWKDVQSRNIKKGEFPIKIYEKKAESIMHSIISQFSSVR